MTPDDDKPDDQATGFFDAMREPVAGDASTSGDGPAEEAFIPEPKELETESSGMLTPRGRSALVHLMRQGSVLARNHGKVFSAIVNEVKIIRSWLAEVNLDMLLDERAGVAFIRDKSDASPEEEDEDGDQGTTSLLAKRTMKLYDTLVLLVLRRHYQERDVAGDARVWITFDEIDNDLKTFLPPSNSEKSEGRNLNGAIKRMREKRLLMGSGADDTYEISPLIRYIVEPGYLENMLAEFQRIGEAHGSDMLEEKGDE